jgi:hypothetical protein
MTRDDYLATVRERLQKARFAEQPTSGGATLRARRRVLDRAGMNTTVVVMKDGGSRATADDFLAFADTAIACATEDTSWLLRGVLSNLLVYPVLMTNGISDELAQFVRSYSSKGRGTMTVAAVVDHDAGSLVISERRTLLGRLGAYEGAREEAQMFLAPVKQSALDV